MLISIQHLLIFFQICFVCLFLTINGFLLKKILLNIEDFKNFEENGLLGFITIGFLSLLVNFFFPLNIIINNFFFSFIIILGFKFKFFQQNIKKLFKRIFITSLLTFFYLIYSNVNTPDAFLYHLPYSRIINEDKLVIGLTNLHSRFGHISIFQYISSFFVNSFFGLNGLLIPIAFVPTFFFIFCYKKFKINFKKINCRENSYFIFLFLVISIYSFSRYSGWGNDAQVHIFYFLSIIFFLENIYDRNNLITFYKLSLVSIFTFFMKPFYIIAVIMPLIFFIKSKKKIKIFKSKTSMFLTLFFILWLLKNFLVSSCLIYPLNATCLKSTSWYNSNTQNISVQGEIWAKDWVNKKDNSISIDNFLENFNWLNTWKENHLKVIIEKISPVVIFIFINFLIFLLSKSFKKKSFKEENFFLISLFVINLLGCLIWFLKFPIFRYGLSYIYSLVIMSCYFIFIRNIDWKRAFPLANLFLAIVYLAFFGSFVKNFSRIYKSDNISVVPLIYDKNIDGKVTKYFNKDSVFIHYKNPIGLCGYSKSPCTLSDTNVKKEIKFGYTIFKQISK